jgi:hypothetical protein
MPTKKTRALVVRTSGETEKVTISSVADIKKLINPQNSDYDYNRDLGVFVYYDYQSSKPVNVFPSFLMQGGYRGDVVIVGDLDKEFNRTDDFQHLPDVWFAESLAQLIHKANNDTRAKNAVESHIR